MAESIGKEMQKYREELLRDVIKAVQIDSSKSQPKPGMPFGEGAAEALNFCLKLGKKFGFTVKNLDNRAGHIEYGEGEPLVGVLAHVDVVPAGEGWHYPPFGGTREDGRIYGRGAMDDKGPAVAAIYCLRALKEMGIRPKGRIRVVLGAAEETGMEDMDYYFSQEPLPDFGFTPDGEYPICNREKGILDLTIQGSACGRILSLQAGSAPNMVPERAKATVECIEQEIGLIEEAASTYEDTEVKFKIGSYAGGKLTIECFGRAAHASTPELGKNAAAHLLRLLSDLDMVGEGLPAFLNQAVGTQADGGEVACSDDSGALTLNLGVLSIQEGEGKAVLDIRYPVSVSGQKIAEGVSRQAETYGLRTDIDKDIVPLFVAPDSPMIRKLSTAFSIVTGQECGLYATGGGSYARSLASRGVAFGAGLKPLSYYRIHGADEFLEVEDFMKHSEICLQAMYELACT